MDFTSFLKKQKEKHKQIYLEYIRDYEEFNYDFIKSVVVDFKTLKLMIDKNVREFKKTGLKNDLNALIEHIYNKLNSVSLITQQQTLNEVKKFGYWDVDFCDITGTIYIDKENVNLELSELVNVHIKDFSGLFEDLHVDVLEEIKTEYEKNKT